MNPQKPNVVLVDYSLATIMMPTTLAGSQIGTQMVLNTFPPVIIQVMLVGLLSFLSINALMKAIAITKKENAEARAKAEVEVESLDATLKESMVNGSYNHSPKHNSLNLSALEEEKEEITQEVS